MLTSVAVHISGFVLYKDLVSDTPATQMVATQLVIGALLLWLIAIATRQPLRLRGPLWRIVLLGSPEEGPLTARIASLMKAAPVVLAGRDRVAFLPALLRRFAVLLTGDTGPMHIAAAVGTPVVALFGPTDPRHTGPVGDHHTILRRDLFCSPCFLKKCPYGHECMEEMTVDEVYRAVRETLRVPVSTRADAGATHG